MHLKISSAKWQPCCLGLDVSTLNLGKWGARRVHWWHVIDLIKDICFILYFWAMLLWNFYILILPVSRFFMYSSIMILFTQLQTQDIYIYMVCHILLTTSDFRNISLKLVIIYEISVKMQFNGTTLANDNTLIFNYLCLMNHEMINTLKPRKNGHHFADDVFKCIFLNENVWILLQISLKFVPNGPINNISSLAQIMAWRRPGDKPLSEPMMVSLLTHICVARPQWVK